MWCRWWCEEGREATRVGLYRFSGMTSNVDSDKRLIASAIYCLTGNGLRSPSSDSLDLGIEKCRRCKTPILENVAPRGVGGSERERILHSEIAAQLEPKETTENLQNGIYEQRIPRNDPRLVEIVIRVDPDIGSSLRCCSSSEEIGDSASESFK